MTRSLLSSDQHYSEEGLHTEDHFEVQQEQYPLLSSSKVLKFVSLRQKGHTFPRSMMARPPFIRAPCLGLHLLTSTPLWPREMPCNTAAGDLTSACKGRAAGSAPSPDMWRTPPPQPHIQRLIGSMRHRVEVDATGDQQDGPLDNYCKWICRLRKIFSCYCVYFTEVLCDIFLPLV